MTDEIELGDTVQDIYTGFKGVAVCRSEFINGCTQYGVAGKWDGKAPDVPEIGIDSGSLKVIKKKRKPKPKPKKRESPGGPTRAAPKLRGY